MVKSVQIGKEIKTTIINKIGALADITKNLADHGINIKALAGYGTDKDAEILLVTDDNLRANDVLIKCGYKKTKENPVIIVELENEVGALKNITAQMAAAGIDIKYVYGTTCATACPAILIFSTSDNEKAATALKK